MASSIVKKNLTWDNIVLRDYFEIIRIAQEDKPDAMDKDVDLIAYIYDVDPQAIWDLPVMEVNELRQSLAFITVNPKAKSNKITKLTIGETTYKVCDKLEDFSYSQYVDFQQYWKKPDNMVDVLSVLIVPEGYKYNSGYDVREVKEQILNNVSVVTATTICSFFLKSLLRYLRSSLKSLERKVKVMKNMPLPKKKEEAEAMKKAMGQLQAMEFILT